VSDEAISISIAWYNFSLTSQRMGSKLFQLTKQIFSLKKANENNKNNKFPKVLAAAS